MSETETPGKVWICPGCGARYDAPTTCSAQHPPLECDEYDLQPASEPASEEGDSSSAPADTSNESSEPDTPPEATGDAPAPEPEPAPELPSAVVDLALVQQALANFDAAYTAFKTKLGL